MVDIKKLEDSRDFYERLKLRRDRRLMREINEWMKNFEKSLRESDAPCQTDINNERNDDETP